MKEIKLFEEFAVPSFYRSVELGIYRDLEDESEWGTCFRMPIEFELEEGECLQYPLEDVLDEYGLYVSDFISSNGSYNAIVLAGELANLQRAKCILGKRVYNQIDTDSGTVSLLIE